MADPTTGLPPQFNGRYPGAPLPVPVPVAPSQFVPRYATSAPGTTSGAIPTFTPASQPAAPLGQPIDTARLNSFTQGAPVASPLQAAAAAATPAAQSTGTSGLPGTGDANSTGVWNVPPLPANMGGVSGPTVGLPPMTGNGAGGVAAGTGAVGAPDTSTWQGYAQQDRTLFDPFGGGGGGMGNVPLSSLPGGGAMHNGQFVDPRDAIAYGYQQQLAYQMASMRNLNAMAGSGGDLGFHARIGALAQAIGVNNFGQAQGQGADSLNQSGAGVAEADTQAAAQENVEATRAASERYAIDAGKETGEVGTELNVPGQPLYGVHPVMGVIQRDANGRATGTSIPFAPLGAATTQPGGGMGTPTLPQYLSAARALNPGRSDDDLKAQYNAKYHKGQ